MVHRARVGVKGVKGRAIELRELNRERGDLRSNRKPVERNSSLRAWLYREKEGYRAWSSGKC